MTEETNEESVLSKVEKNLKGIFDKIKEVDEKQQKMLKDIEESIKPKKEIKLEE